MEETIERILGKLEFNKIPEYGLSTPATRKLTLGGASFRDSSSRGGRIAIRSLKRADTPKGVEPSSEKEIFIGSLEAAADNGQNAEEMAADKYGSLAIDDVTLTRGGLTKGADSLGAFRSVIRDTSEQSKKPEEILALEHVLSIAYDTNIRIGYVREIPQTRKQVKEVRFKKPDDPWLYKIWVFKADPVITRREMTIYYIASQAGVPTGKPIGFKPEAGLRTYPFDIAMLGGGIVEHAGDSYDALIRNMQYEPGDIHQTAISIARMVADAHAKLTSARNQFDFYGISLQKANPSTELKTRIFDALKLNFTSDASMNLVDACLALYKRQTSLDVISHGDLHTGNIVTRARLDADHTSDFGMIDFGSVMIDTWLGDLYDFFIHHKRKAMSVCGNYPFSVSDIENAYLDQFGITSRMRNLDVSCSLSKIDSAVQSCLWNLYEMFDPTRKNKADIMEKAIYHSGELAKDFTLLAKLGLGNEVSAINSHLADILCSAGYKSVIPDYSSRRSVFDIFRRR
jgi:hypothetical protein